jgi:hypothetical protein
MRFVLFSNDFSTTSTTLHRLYAYRPASIFAYFYIPLLHTSTTKNRTDGCLNVVVVLCGPALRKQLLYSRSGILPGASPSPSKKAADEVYAPLSLDFVDHLAQPSRSCVSVQQKMQQRRIAALLQTSTDRIMGFFILSRVSYFEHTRVPSQMIFEPARQKIKKEKRSFRMSKNKKTISARARQVDR